MSTTSCPRCNGQVTLPHSVSNDASVRCPLCHEQYTLADALAAVPPMLELVETVDAPLDFESAADEPAMVSPGEAGATDELEFPADEASEDDLAVSFDFDEPDASPAEASDEDELSLESGEAEPAASAEDENASSADDDMAIDFGEELSAEDSEAETLELGSAQASDLSDDLDFSATPQDPADEQAATLEFSAQPVDDDDALEFDLDAPQETASGGDATIEFDNGDGIQFEPDDAQESAATAPNGLGEFGDVQVEPTGNAEDDIALDMPDEPAAVPVADDEQDDPKGKKKRKKKAKAANGKSGGSPLVKFGLPFIVGVPVALYAAVWIGYDPVGLGKMLPEFMVPAAEKPGGQSTVAQITNYPDEADPSMPAEKDPLAPTDDSPALDPADESAPDDNPLDASTPPQDMPADDNPFAADASPALEEQPELNPFDPANLESEAMPAEDAAADDPLGEPASPETAPAEPATEPEAAPEMPADDPFGTPAADSPAEPAATDDPFGTPAAESTPEPAAADNPFGSPAAENTPAAADDPFATPATDSGAPAAEAPFAATPNDNEPLPEPAAEDPFALTPADSESLPAPAESAEAVEVLGPRNAADVAPAKVAETVQATMAAGQQMAAAEQTGDAAGVRKARANFYVTLFGMADALTLGQLGPGAAQLDPQLKALEPMILEQLASDPKQIESLKLFGARWFAFPKRTTNGVVLAGTVDSVDQAGRLFHTRIKPAQDSGDAVTIVSAKDPQLAAGDEVITLGSIVEDPADQVAGYEGSEPSVVWSGMTLKVPAAAP